ncbi:MAG: hypothetical protein WAW90_00260 [Minisyncoccia bacterium]
MTLVIACVVGALCIAPQIYFAYIAPHYAGIELMGQDAEEHYLARIQEVYDGNYLTGNTYLPYKDTSYFIPPLGENIVAFVGKSTGVSSSQINVLSKFIFPIIAFLLIYSLAFALTKRRGVALLGTVSTMLTGTILSDPRGLLDLLHGTSTADGIYWSRPVNPEVSSLFLFGALLLSYHLFFTERTAKWRALIATGVLTGCLLYISPYPWAFLGAFIVICFTWNIYARDFTGSIRPLSVGLLALACAIPFASNYFHARALAGYAYATIQHNVLTSHAPILGFWLVTLFAIPLFFWPKQLSEARNFFIVSAVALLVVLNQQVITGFYLQAGHFHWYITKPLAGLMFGLLAGTLIERHVLVRAWRFGAYSLIIGLLLVYTSLAQVHFYQLHSPSAISAQAYAPLLAYLRTLPEPQTILANEDISNYVAIYTKDDAPGSNYAPLYLAPQHYFDTLSSLKSALATTSRSSRRIADLTKELQISLIVIDEHVDPWSLTSDSGFSKKQTIAERFVVYESVGSTSTKK